MFSWLNFSSVVFQKGVPSFCHMIQILGRSFYNFQSFLQSSSVLSPSPQDILAVSVIAIAFPDSISGECSHNAMVTLDSNSLKHQRCTLPNNPMCLYHNRVFAPIHHFHIEIFMGFTIQIQFIILILRASANPSSLQT